MASKTPTMQTRWTQTAVPERPASGGYPIPKPSDFAHVREPVPSPDDLLDGEVLVKHAFLSPDPYIVSMIMARQENVGKTVWSGAVGYVTATRSDKFQIGDVCVGGGQMGAQEYSKRPADALFKFSAPDSVPLSTSLGVCGMPGVTAYLATRNILGADLSGKTIVVTGAAGAVGSAAGQIAKLLGASKVIGLAGSDEKCTHCVQRFGFDSMLNYKSKTLGADLASLAPFHGFYDNTGGPAAKIIKTLLVDGAPVAKVGSIGGDSASPEHDDRLHIQGFYAGGQVDKWPAAIATLASFVAEKKLLYDETVVHGISSVPDAFIRQRTGKQLGKMIVDLR